MSPQPSTPVGARGMKKLTSLLALTLLALAPSAVAQEIPAPDHQIAAAVQPLPPELRDGATVLGYREGSDGLVTLREGEGAMVCVADDPANAEQWHVACYHESLSPFIERGRELRAGGADQETVDSVRAAEAESGEIPMPEHPASVYNLSGPPDAFDPETGRLAGRVRSLYALYMPWATAESTGLPTRPAPGEPWIMDPGKAWAHVMLMEPPSGGN